MRNFNALLILLVFISVATKASSLQTTVPNLFSDLGHSKQASVISAKQHIPENERHLYSAKQVNLKALRELKQNDSIQLNLPKGDTKGEVIDVFSGASGTKHIVIRSYIGTLPVSSIISIGKANVFMELTIEHGVFSAAGDADEVLIHQPSEVFNAKGFTLENDVKIPQGLSCTEGVSSKRLASHTTNSDNARPIPPKSTLGSYQPAFQTPFQTAEGAKGENAPLPASNVGSLADYGDIAVFDLLIVYSSNVTDVVDDINAKIDHYVAYTNRAFEDSKIYAKVRVKGVMEVEYPYTNGDIALDDITFGKAPFEGVAQERVRVGADAVALLTPNSENDTSSGIAWQLPHINSGYFSSYGRMYSQTDVNNGASTFAHELGHNLGLGHSRPQGATGADFDFGVGYRIPAPGAGFSTIMAYQTRDAYEVPFFSNPALLCGSLPCGLPKDDQDFGADAAYTINQVRARVANYSSIATELIPIDDALSLIADANLKRCINNEVEEQTRYASEIYYLGCYQEVSSLEGIENFSSMSSIYLTNVSASDLTPLKSLENLNWLTISGTLATDFSVLEQLPQLESFSVSGDFFDATQAEYLLALPNLQRLYIANDKLTQLPDLSSLTVLEDVTLSTSVSDLSVLQRNTMLTSLAVYSNTDVTIPADASWPALESLFLNSGTLENLSLITRFENLRSLSLQNNALTTIDGIGALSNLESLYLSGNNISDISALSALTSLKALSIGYNPINDISAISGLTALTELRIEEIDTNDLSALSGLSNLRSLDAGSYGYTTNWSVISNMPLLKQLGLTGVARSDLPFIEDKSDQLTSLYLSQVSSPDLSFLFNHYKLSYLGVYPAVGTRFYCWQASYLNRYQIGAVNVGGGNIENECDTTDDTNDFDNDGVNNIDEIANNTNPLEDNGAPSRVAFLIDTLDVFETADWEDSRHTVVVKRSGDTSQRTSLDFTVIEDTATQGVDFRISENALQFEPGQNFTTFELTVVDDVRIEGEENFSLELSNMTNAEPGELSKIEVTINDNKDGSDFQNESGGCDANSR